MGRRKINPAFLPFPTGQIPGFDGKADALLTDGGKNRKLAYDLRRNVRNSDTTARKNKRIGRTMWAQQSK
jgi:hypothetical protein